MEKKELFESSKKLNLIMWFYVKESQKNLAIKDSRAIACPLGNSVWDIVVFKKIIAFSFITVVVSKKSNAFNEKRNYFWKSKFLKSFFTTGCFRITAIGSFWTEARAFSDFWKWKSSSETPCIFLILRRIAYQESIW